MQRGVTDIGDQPGSLGAPGWTPGPASRTGLTLRVASRGLESLLPQPKITAVTVTRPGTTAFYGASTGSSHSGDCTPQRDRKRCSRWKPHGPGRCLRNTPFLLPPERREPTPLLGAGRWQRLSTRDRGGCRIWVRVGYRFCLGGHLGQEAGDAPLLVRQQLVSQLHHRILLGLRWKAGTRAPCFWGGVPAGTTALCHREACLSSKLPRPEPGGPSCTATRRPATQQRGPRVVRRRPETVGH